MKYLMMLVIGLMLTGCASKTEFGDCVGINDDKNPNLVYKYSTRNIIVGAIFVETLFVPLIVTFNQLQCPEGVK